MKQFLAVYTGSIAAQERSGWDKLSEADRAQRIKDGIAAWQAWGEKHKRSIVWDGGPLGKTTRTGPAGVSDIKNAMAGYIVIQAESHEAAAKMFEGHPHFTLFPGEAVEVLECLPVPQG